MDNRFLAFYQEHLQQIFIYITYECNYSCRHCLIGDRSKSSFSKDEIFEILSATQRLGCRKVTLLGGEPTLHPNLLEIIDFAKKLDLSVVLDTNGSFSFDLWSESRFCQIDTFCFSIDGHIDSIHDRIRGKGSFSNLLKQIQYAKDRKHKVKFTHTITKENIEYIIDMIHFANDLGIDEFNVHVATINGRAKYIDDPNIISPNTWYRTYEHISEYVQKATLNDNFSLRIPPRYCTFEELAYKYRNHLCISQIKDRVLILPEDKAKGDKGGPLYLCGLLIGERKRLGSNIQGEFVFNINGDAEAMYYRDIPYANGTQLCPIVFHDNENPNYFKDNNLFPLCISYKPNLRTIALNERSR